MKTSTLLYIIAATAICSCNQNKQNSSSEAENTIQDTPMQPKTNTIRKEMHVTAPFSYLTSITGADIEYTQGDYKMVIEGDSALINFIETDYESGLLTLSFASERNSAITRYESKLNLTIHISAPKLQCVSICGYGDFTSHGMWRGERIEFGLIGSGSFKCDSIECDRLNFQSSGAGDATFAHIKSPNIHFANTGITNIDAFIDTDTLAAENVGRSTFTFHGRARMQDLSPTKYGRIVMQQNGK